MVLGPQSIDKNTLNFYQAANKISFKNKVQPASEEEGSRDTKLYEACSKFAALFYQELFRTMRNTVPEDGLIRQSFGNRVFQDMLDSRLAEDAAKQNGDRLTELLYRQLTGR